MTEASISLKPVNDLLRERFFIPSYQRGYRWTSMQVIDLLNDIWEFQTKCEKREHFYCLQPIVVKRREAGEWELVDGQQRLTTIHLILSCRADLVRALRKPKFSLRFETRQKSEEFLNKIDPAQREANIDYFHICQAYEAIESWFAKRDGSHDLQLLQCLTNDDEAGKNVKVIWYELPQSEDPVNAFTRLNVGKIPLTNSELIRALFLRSRNFGGNTKHTKQIKIAQEWDTIEKSLQSDEMWYFLTSGATTPSSRIEFIFDLIARERQSQSATDPFATFHFYNDLLALPKASPEYEWLQIKQAWMVLEEWFTDRVLFHLVGFLIHGNFRISEIRKSSANVTKAAFRKNLREAIFFRLLGEPPPEDGSLAEYQAVISEFVDGLDYDDNPDQIRSLLLLFNIATILLNPKSNVRFPFHHFKKEQWDIEHVRSVDSRKPDREPRCKDWLREFSSHLNDTDEGAELRTRADAICKRARFAMDQFDDLYSDILKAFQETGETEADNSVGNLTLLDARTNRSYKNAVFPVKRNRIIGLDRKGTFVPICTKNVFLKCYSKTIGKMMFWGEDDRDSYQAQIVETIAKFFAEDVVE